ncbi:MAG: efflux RND transporter periplasmic adaptor subunit [Vicinamibacteria bacterium]
MKHRFLLLGLALTPLACGGSPKADGPKIIAEAAPLAVSTVEVGRPGETARWIAGEIRPRTRATLSARFSAVVTSVAVREGDAVAKGATLVVLEDAPLRAALAAAESQVATAAEDDRRMRVLRAKDAATQREVDEASTRLASARASLAAAKDALLSASIRAPFAGTIATRTVQPGDLAGPGMPLLELQGLGALELVVPVEAATAASLRPGSVLRAKVDGIGAPVTARVRSVAPSANPLTHRIDVLCDIESPGSELRAGLFARVALPEGAGDSTVLTVPATSLVRRGGLTGVFVVEGNRAHLRWIALGAENGTDFEVRAGLVLGETIVDSPLGLVDGASIRTAAR